MALVNLPTAQLKFTLRDASGSVGHLLIHVPYATAASVAIAAADAISGALALLTGCVFLGYSLTYAKAENAPGSADVGSRVENKGEFVWLTADGRQTRFSLPGIKSSLLNVDGSVDRSAADVIAMIALVEDVGSIFAGASGSDITAILQAYQRFSRSTKGQLPSAR